MAIASVSGLESLSIDVIASELGLSTENIYALFGDRETLQLHTLDAIVGIFEATIVKPALDETAPIKRLYRLCEGWFDIVEQRGLTRGCILYATINEYRTRLGFIGDRVNYHRTAWLRLLGATIAEAQGAMELDDALDIEQLIFDLTAFQEAAHAAAVFGDQAGFLRARNSCRDRIAAAQAV